MSREREDVKVLPFFIMIDKPWILIKKKFPEGIRYLLQMRRTDAIRPYYLTQKVFIARKAGLRALQEKLKEI